MKHTLLNAYKASEYYTEKWINNNLPPDKQQYYNKFLLPPFHMIVKSFPLLN